MENENNNKNNEDYVEDKPKFIDDSWLDTLKLTSSDHLAQLDRAVCPNCKKKRKYFCYDCYIPFGDPELAPKLKLPIKCDILHYPTELLSKSTAIHSKVVANSDVSIYEFPEVPDYDVEETVLLFPSDTSDFVRESDLSGVKRVVFIDSQWHTANRILRDARVKKLRCIKIDQHKTLFWRYQKHGDSFLATIEAIYYFYKEFHQRLHNNTYEGQYDDLLYYYTFFYRLIQNTYKEGDRHFWRKENYIKPEKTLETTTTSDNHKNESVATTITTTTTTTEEQTTKSLEELKI
ncbi:hypothetical protein PPL_02998 [Heterostelium album PN500]|uniref:tRNA-uridine aminocarboxypropyltransferase 1 n=1 Tax=Heterostelium pallidum (strain ATCC 26659 / Pp 5 / PN500) TaxID=670386 RepID=D3B3N0_HETP5|nr:hypothetical protein PPL_02998 [Heterostelium album PN500]EFA83928.1 hypothetical protein PPL_02998 [Heterostelium album PN500]|eukprot:XP_020436045.1 hypothetical protein PPL_02998 [Heterostelium album PN500]